MKCTNEIVSAIEEIPVKIFIENIEKVQYRLSCHISLVFVISGNISIKQNNYHYKLMEEDILLINSNTVYTIESSSANQICLLQIDGGYFDSYYANFSNLIFKLNSLDYHNHKQEEYNYIKSILVKLLDILIKKENGYMLIAKQLILEFIVCLINIFTDDKPKETLNMRQDDERINSIIEFILIHYKEKITLNDIAGYLHLNPQYISRYFSKQMGITLNSFISNIRLKESINALEGSDKKITYIALEYGFPNLKSYFKAFKDTYNMTPLKYRSIFVEESNKNIVALDFSKSNLKYFVNDVNDKYSLVPSLRENYEVDCSSYEGVLNKTWRKILAFGRAAEGMKEELRNQLRLVQKEIPFEYVRFHGILSDEMRVYSEDSQGNSEYNFTYIDQLIDFLLEIKLKPFIEIGYMPEQLASEKKYIFAWKANISLPKNIEKWNNLIKNFVIHLIERYGIDEVRSWYFQSWGEWPFFESEGNAVFNFLKNNYHIIKNVDSKLKIGSRVDIEKLEDFMSFVKEEKLGLDFLAVCVYSLVPIEPFKSISEVLKSISVSENIVIPQDSIRFASYGHENFISEEIYRYNKILNRNKGVINEVFITEWNSSPSQKDLLHDTCFKASFFAKNILDNFDKVNSMAYWSFSDIFEETKTSNHTFHGGLGFITNNGIKKPIYYVYQLMNKLGNYLIKRGNDFIVTKSENSSIQILAFNYCHFANLYQKCYSEDITQEDRYNVFNEKTKNISFLLKNLQGEMIEKIYRINKENGSAFDKWLEIGAPKGMSFDEINYIKNKSIYGYEIKKIHASGDVIINEKMGPHEVLLIEILPAK